MPMIIHLNDYRHLFDGEDAALAVQEALLACRKHPGAVLKLGGGTLHFYPRYAFEKEYYISNNDYSKKSIIFPLLDMEGITIDGEGAELLFHGMVLPFVIDGSRNITIQNLSVDYPHPFFFQGRITAAEENYLELEYDPVEFSARTEEHAITFYCAEEDWAISADRLLVCEFEADTKAPSAFIPPYFAYFPEESDGSFLSGMYRYLKPEQPTLGKLRLTGDCGCRHTVGNMWVGTFSGRENPGIFGNHSENIFLRDVTLYHTASMGVICQLCENITMERLKTIVRPGSGRYLSVNADSTHFVNCSGAIHYEACTFTNMLDDAGNVHGHYNPILKALDCHTLLLTFGHYQQQGINIYQKGDQVHVVDNTTIQPTATLTVKDSTLLSATLLRLEFEESLPPLKTGYVVENFTRMPELYIHGCTCGHNRPRGFLPSTWRKIVISDNTFFNMQYAIHITSDCNDWFESGPVEDVLITGNRFQNAAYTGGAVIAIDPRVQSGEGAFHKNIRIQNNLFELHEKRFLFAHNTDSLVIQDNRYIQNPSLPAHPAIGIDGIDIQSSINQVIQVPDEQM